MKESQQTYRFGQAAAAIGVKEQTLRNWLFRHGDFDLFNERPEGGWRAFTEADVIVLAVTAELIRVSNATVSQAISAVRLALGEMDFLTNAGMPNVIHFAPNGLRWFADENEKLVREVTGSPTVVSLAVPIVIRSAVGRLRFSFEDLKAQLAEATKRVR